MRFRSSLAAAMLSLALVPMAFAQAQSTPAPAQQSPSAPSAAPSQQPPSAASEVPSAPKPVPAPPPFPLIDRANFTAASPTVDTVNAFLKASWGYDANRVWQVQAILKTAVPNLSKVIILVEEKGSAQQQPATLAFFVLPDGTHLIASEEVLPFGPDPYSEIRKQLQSRADGPSMGAPSKTLELVEFSDFQCPHCKDAAPTVEKLMKDFPNAHIVYQNFPLNSIHSEAEKAAEYGVCVNKAGGSAAFSKYAENVFANQAKLTPETSTDTLKAAVTAAGQDPSKIAACVASPEARSTVNNSVQLGRDLGVSQTPWLFINGRGLPLGGVPYDTLKTIVSYQAQMDGAAAQ